LASALHQQTRRRRSWILLMIIDDFSCLLPSPTPSSKFLQTIWSHRYLNERWFDQETGECEKTLGSIPIIDQETGECEKTLGQYHIPWPMDLSMATVPCHGLWFFFFFFLVPNGWASYSYLFGSSKPKSPSKS